MRAPIVIRVLLSLLCRGEFPRVLENFYIQPIIDLSSGRVCGGEVLWRPNHNVPSPEEIQALE